LRHARVVRLRAERFQAVVTTNLVDGVGGPQDPAVRFTPAEIVAEMS